MLSNATNQPKSTIELGYMCPRGLSGPPKVTLAKKLKYKKRLYSDVYIILYRMSLNIFLIYTIYLLCCLFIDFYDLSAWCGCWFVVYIRRVYLQSYKCMSFWLHGCCEEWEGGPVNHTSWVSVVNPTDRPKSVRNCCLIELFCGVVCVVTLPFWHFCWCRGFCHRTGSDLLLFVLINNMDHMRISGTEPSSVILSQTK